MMKPILRTSINFWALKGLKVPEKIDLITNLIASGTSVSNKEVQETGMWLLEHLEQIIEIYKRMYDSIAHIKARDRMLPNFDVILDSIPDMIDHEPKSIFWLLKRQDFPGANVELGYLLALVEVYLKFAAPEKIMESKIYDFYGEQYYRWYVERLPGDSLLEFLTSKNEGARTLAKNKVVKEMTNG